MARVGTTTQVLAFGTCPACREPVTIEVVVEVGILSMERDDNGLVNAKAQVTGARIDHDCRPRITRESLESPHSRACGLHQHQHGVACAGDCPTCHGRARTD